MQQHPFKVAQHVQTKLQLAVHFICIGDHVFVVTSTCEVGRSAHLRQVSAARHNTMSEDKVLIIHIDVDSPRERDGVDRPQRPLRAAVPPFVSRASPPVSFSTCKAEEAVRAVICAQENEAREAIVAANKKVLQLVGSRKRKASRPQRAWAEDTARNTNTTSLSFEISSSVPSWERKASSVKSVSSAGRRRKQGMTADQALRAMEKIVKCRLKKSRKFAMSPAFYKVYPLLFGHS
jgi:hypothetical protein